MKQRVLVALAAGIAAAPLAFAQAPAPAAPGFAPPTLTPAGVRALAANCAMCHGTQGRTVDGSSVASLAGRNARELTEAMNAFKAGTRPATIMHQIAKGYSDAEIAAMSEYFARSAR